MALHILKHRMEGILLYIYWVYLTFGQWVLVIHGSGTTNMKATQSVGGFSYLQFLKDPSVGMGLFTINN